MNVDGARMGKLARKSIGDKRNFSPTPTQFARISTRTLNRSKPEGAHFWGKRKSTCSLILAEVNDFIRLYFSTLFFRLFYAPRFLPIYTHLLPHNIVSYHARLLCIRIFFLLMYSAHDSSLIEIHVVLGHVSVGFRERFWKHALFLWFIYIQLHNIMSHGALYMQS